MKKILSCVLLALMLAISLVGLKVDIVNADDGQIGMTAALPDGSEATCIGRTSDGKYIWETKIGQPVYIPGTTTKYDTTWHGAGDNYTAGANSFTARVDGETVRVWYADQASMWTPRVDIGKDEVKATKAILLAVDPVNENYRNNTLMWDYGNGVRRYVRIIEGLLREYYVIDKEQTDTFKITPNVSKSEGFIWHRESIAFDADKKIVSLDKTSSSLSMAKSVATKEGKVAKYPVTIDPDTSFISYSYDGYLLYQAATSYATAWTSTTANLLVDSTVALTVGQIAAGATPVYYYVYRDPLYFGTSSISGYTITAASLHLYLYPGLDDSDTDFAVTVTNGQPTYPHMPMEYGDYNKANYATTDGGNVNTATFAGGAYYTITLNADGRSWINTSGTTKFFIRSNRDIAGVTPTGDECVTFYAYEQGFGYWPYLLVTYTTVSPSVTMNSASSVSVTTARLNATIDSDGGEGCQVRWGYGTTSKTSGNFTSYDTVTSWSTGNYTTGQHPYDDISSLVEDTTYYARIQVKNTSGNVTSGEISFTTTAEASLSPPSNVMGLPSETSVELSWVKGTGSDSVVVRYSVAGFPTDNTTGTLVYSGGANTYTHGSLTGGQTYFYSLWGMSGDNWSATYTTYAMTTSAFTIGTGDDFETPSMFANWFRAPDYTNLSELEPIYSTVNGVADSLGMPRNVAWQGLIVFLIVILSAVALAATKQLGTAVVVALLGLGIGTAMHILPAVYFGFTLIAAIAGMILKSKLHTAGE